MAVGGVDAMAVARALRGGVATLDVLAARTGAARDDLLWAIDDAAARGWVEGPSADGEGVCGSRPPATYVLTEAGRRALVGD